MALACAVAQPVRAQAPSRGELLYTTHCVACHTTQVHWRDRRLVVDWPSLQEQVRRWQGRASLNWSDEDVRAVSRYLNQRFYRFKASPEGAVIAGAEPARAP